MYYSTPDSKVPLNTLSQFLKEMGLSKDIEAEATLKVTKGSIPEETRVVVLSYDH
jgi:hypothetical protein